MESNLSFADVILPLAIHDCYTYYVPKEFENKLQVGCRVIVPFGKSKKYTGIINEIHQRQPALGEIKSIEDIFDENPLVNSKQLQLWKWISSYYMCNIGEVYTAAVPNGLKLESDSEIMLGDQPFDEDLSEQEKVIIEYLSNGETRKITEINKLLGVKNCLPIIKRIINTGYITVCQKIQNNYREKYEKIVKFSTSFTNEKEINKLLLEVKNYKQQQHLLSTFIEIINQTKTNEITQSYLLKKSEVSSTVLNTLHKKGVFEIYEKKTDRLKQYETNKDLLEANTLNEQQQEVIEKILASEKKIHLLHGVTSSGKTEVYIHLIKQAISKNQQVLFLVPEIALTTQMTDRLKRIFGNILGVYHSKFNDAERVEIWKKQVDKDNPYKIILGVRSSIFLPFQKLGLVIVDEEHEGSYKQQNPNPRYNARDIAIVLASYFNAKTILGSATPSIESYYKALAGKYQLVEINQRHMNVSMPEIRAVNMLEVYHKKQHISNFSAELLDEIDSALKNKEQVILFQNRRGYSPYLECSKCAHIPKCKYCDVSLTYYEKSKQLNCHYCGFGIGSSKTCPQCKNGTLITRGFGTEKIESELKELFWEARIQRMDLDSTRTKNAHEQLIRKFENHDLDILVGTQMVTKGLDFAGVHIVGIMNADNMLNFPDFRAFERSYQIMAQVSGRAGRSKKRGLVILQTNNPNHSIIKQVIENNYLSMYEDQIAERKSFNYPPFSRMIKISLQHAEKGVLNEAMKEFSNNLKLQLNTRVLGPEWPVINRIKSKYIKCLIVKIGNSDPLTEIKLKVLEEIKKLQLKKSWSSIRAIIDVDPI